MKYTIESFVTKAISIHGDKYNYSNITELHWSKKIPIYCNKCNSIFYQQMHSHLSGNGCFKCALNNTHDAVRKLSKIKYASLFKEKAIKIHGNLYTYEKALYNGASDKIKIFCTQCGNYFYQTPSDHLSGCGCTNCRYTKYSNTKISKYGRIFLENAPLIHGDKYDYSKVIYKGERIKVEIFCKRCNKYFFQSPDMHLRGSGCKTCGNSLSHDEFIIKAKIVHGSNYDYSEAFYITGLTPVKIKCNYCNEFFLQKPTYHLMGYGCRCNKGGYSKSSFRKVCERRKSSDPKLYIIRCFNATEEFVKIGITSHFVHNRFRRPNDLRYSYEILKEIKGTPNFVWEKEKEMHLKCKQFKYIPNINFSGMSECFTLECLDVLNL